MVCEQIEALQRRALDAPRPELVVKVDRSGLNEHHPLVQKLYAAIDRVLKPIVAEEERRAGAHLIGTARAITARDQVGLRALNDALKAAFDHPGSSRREPGSAPASAAPDEHSWETVEPDDAGETNESDSAEPAASPVVAALFFKQSPIRIIPVSSAQSQSTPTQTRCPPAPSSRWTPTPASRSPDAARSSPSPGRAGSPRSPGPFARR